MVHYDVPPNNEWANVAIIQSLPYQGEDGTMLGALDDFAENSYGAYDSANGVWYTYIPTQDSIVVAYAGDVQGMWVYARGYNDDDINNNDNEGSVNNNDLLPSLTCIPNLHITILDQYHQSLCGTSQHPIPIPHLPIGILRRCILRP